MIRFETTKPRAFLKTVDRYSKKKKKKKDKMS